WRGLGGVGDPELRQGTARARSPGRPWDVPGAIPQRPGRGAVTGPEAASAGGLAGAQEVRAIVDAALDLPGAAGVEVLFIHQWGGLTRFASSSIHQSTWREDTEIRVRVEAEGRIG